MNAAGPHPATSLGPGHLLRSDGLEKERLENMIDIIYFVIYSNWNTLWVYTWFNTTLAKYRRPR
jgi:hypothetical protein